MKNLVFLLSLVLFIGSINLASGQDELSKEEKKEWKRKAKELKKNPILLKQISDENESMKSEISAYKRQISSLEAKVDEKQNEVDQLKQQVSRLEAELAASKERLAAVKKEAESEPAEKPVYDDSGVVFKVQIGAFRNKDLSKYFNNTENFSGEITDEGVQKITLGRFRDYWEADTFKKYLREMGVSDAWIVPYKDGKRVAMKDVLEGVI